MKAKNQGEVEEYCPINLDYIFAKDDPLLPWLENKEKEIDTINNEEENYQGVNRTTKETHQEIIIEVEENSSSATHTDHGSRSNGDNGPKTGSKGGTSETIVPNTYPYTHPSQLQLMTSEDGGKSQSIEEEEEEEEREEEELLRMDYMER